MVMQPPLRESRFGAFLITLLATVLLLVSAPRPATAQVTAFKQAVAEAAASDPDIAAFYRENGYSGMWTGSGGRDKARRTALLEALSEADLHGLPTASYDVPGLMERMKSAKGGRERGALEVELSRVFLKYAIDLQTGILTPSRVDSEIKREVPLRARISYLTAMEKSSPKALLKALAPQSAEYNRLMKEKLDLERLLANGGWGPKVPGKAYKPGEGGNGVVALRNRLQAMGYLGRSAAAGYDAALQQAVQAFQMDHGLTADGVAGPDTLSEINVDPAQRLTSVIVAMERERWMNLPEGRGKRHILVNLTDFTAKIMDNDKVTFETRSVVGKNAEDHRTPEFSDQMEFMVINPSWYVPRSIATKEYLPMLKQNPNAVRHLEITDSNGRKINRSSVNFAQYTEASFPFSMREPPSLGNALGLVKFMFPNKYNIYLHDTPSKSLFGREVRAFSHGCIRLNDPQDFAYALLAPQTNDPQGLFQAKLRTGVESRVDLAQPVPVHLIYRTAVTQAKGKINYRRDIYGRDARIWRALENAGVALRAVRS